MNTAAATRAGVRSRSAGDDGFTLIEVVVALMLTIVVMTVTAGFFIRSLGATRLMQQRQSAVAVAERAIERVRAEPASALDSGRDETIAGCSVAPPTTCPTGTDRAYYLGNISYRVRTSIESCWASTTGATCGAQVPGTFLMYRINVSVKWKPPNGDRCAGATECEYTVSTLRDPAGVATTPGSLREAPTT